VATCTAAPPAPRAAIVAGIVGEPSSLMDERDPGARFMSGLAMEKLVRFDDKDELVPRLVTSVPSFENGLVRIVADERDPSGRLLVTFVLRPDLVWHDGSPLTTDDVVFAWQLALDAPADTGARADAALVERVEVLDSLRVVFHLRPGIRTPRYPLLAHAMPRHLLGGPDPARDAQYSRRPVHAGPFVIVSWQDGFGATFAPFERYALGKPGLSRVEVRFFVDREALLDALSKGVIDTVPAGPLTADLIPRIAQLTESRGLLPHYVPQEAADMLLFNMRRAPFDDRRARRAVVKAR
jgi:ABC-type transport system substrate-binding protein